jgi:hypothetical protein
VSAPIVRFAGAYRFLSNFHRSPITLGGIVFPTVENAYQAAKIELERPDRRCQQQRLALCSPADAKRRGRALALRPDWDSARLVIMHRLLRLKFAEPCLAGQLLATGSSELIEGNDWGDTYWGVCRGRGANHLGRLLMHVRTDLRSFQPKERLQ